MTARINLKMIALDIGVDVNELIAVMPFCKVTMNHGSDGFVWGFNLELGRDCPKDFFEKLDPNRMLEPNEQCENYYIPLACELDMLTSEPMC